MEKQQLFRDAEIAPTNDLVAKALGATYTAYASFVEELDRRAIEVDWRYYNDGKSWLGKGLYKWTTSRGTPKELTACWLSIWDGFFRVGFTFPEKYRAELANLPLGCEVKQMMASSSQMGKLKIFPLAFDLTSDKLFDDVYALLEFKKSKK